MKDEGGRMRDDGGNYEIFPFSHFKRSFIIVISGV